MRVLSSRSALRVVLAATFIPALLVAQAATPAERPAARATAMPLPEPSPWAAPVAAPAVSFDSTVFTSVRWREIGPYRGGRSVAVAGSSSRLFEYWMGTTGGGVFKTTDGGLSWLPVTDKYFGGTIGAIGVSESNPDIVYVGGGEYPIRGNTSHGYGVWKTTNGGATWTDVGLRETEHISRVKVHPANPDIVYVGAQGHAFGPHPARGVYKTTDGGKNWRKVKFVSDTAGVTDLVLDPKNPDIIYAAFWHAYRTPWLLNSGGSGSGLWKSTDGGETWTELTRNPGLPGGIWGNIGVTVSPANSNRVWAIIEAVDGGVYRSDDAGRTWTKLNDERKLRQRAWYYTRIFADPKDTNVVHVLNVQWFKSLDGGRTFRTQIRVPHGDNHDLWIASNDGNRMIEGNDGGANVSVNGGRTWTDQDYATAQMYHVSTTNHYPYKVCGAQQDNSTLCGPSRNPGGIGREDWVDAGGGESGYVTADPRNPDIIYAGSYGGLLTRKDLRTGFERNISPWPMNPMGHSSEDIKYRFQWTYPIVFSPHDPNVLYVGGSQLFRSTTGGASWTIISPPLARNDPKTLGPSGGPIARDQTGVETYGTIFAFAESPAQRGVLWVGTDDGYVQVSRDNGRSWQNVTSPAWGEFARISSVEPSRYSAGTAYIAANRFQQDDKQPYLFRTNDYGRTWTRIDDGISRTEFTRVLREDPVRRGLLYAGTELGVWVSFNDGASWQKMQRNLPPVPVHDLVVKDADLVAATHGRSFYIVDDLSVLRQVTPEIAAKSVHLFRPRDAYRLNLGGGFGGGGEEGRVATTPTGQNPPSGAVFQYYLRQQGQRVEIDILDTRGRTIRTFNSDQDSIGRADSLRTESRVLARRDSLARTGIAADTALKLAREQIAREPIPAPDAGIVIRMPRVANKAGVNTFVWNMRYPEPEVFPGMILWAAGAAGPLAVPGTYTVRLRAAGETQSYPFVIRKDPRSEATQADLVAQFNEAMRIRDRFSEANRAVSTIRDVRWQVNDRRTRLRGPDSTEFGRIAGAMDAKTSAVENEVYQTRNQSSQDPLNFPIKLNNKIGALMGTVSAGDYRPTAQVRQVFNELSGQLETQLIGLKVTLESELPKLNAILKRNGLDEIRIKPPPPKTVF